MVYFFNFPLFTDCFKSHLSDRLESSIDAKGCIEIFTAGEIKVKPTLVIIAAVCTFVNSMLVLFALANTDPASYMMLRGNAAVILSLLFYSVKLLIDEIYMHEHDYPPLLIAGFAGTVGFILSGLSAIPGHFIPGLWRECKNRNEKMEDFYGAYLTLKYNGQYLMWIIGLAATETFRVYCHFATLKKFNSTTVMAIICGATIPVWTVALLLHWEDFSYLQLIGYMIIVLGICLYCDYLVRPAIYWMRHKFNNLRDRMEGSGTSAIMTFD